MLIVTQIPYKSAATFPERHNGPTFGVSAGRRTSPPIYPGMNFRDVLKIV